MNGTLLPLLFIWTASYILPAQSDSSFAVFNQHTQKLDLRPFCRVYVDKTAAMPLAGILEKVPSPEFIPLDSLRMAGKFEAGKYNYWICFRIRNTSEDTLRPVFNLAFSEIFWVYAASKGWEEAATGGKLLTYCPDCWQRPLPSRLSDDLPLLPEREDTFLLKMKFKFTPHTILPVLYDPDRELLDFIQGKSIYYISYAFFFIFLLSILAISLLQYFFNRETIYLYYALYIIATLAFFWRSFENDDPVITVFRHVVDIKDYTFYTPLNLFVMFCYLLFIERLVEARAKYPEIWKLIRFGMYYLLFYLAIDRLAIWYDYRFAWRIASFFRLFFMGYCLFMLFRLIRLRANPVVRYVLIGSGMLLVFSVSNTLFGLSKLQYLGDFDLSILSNQVGIVLETLYFFVAMGYRSRWLDLENHRMETTLLLREKEAERLKSLDEIKSRLFANFTHEFRTPLTLIMGLAKKAESEGKPLEMSEAQAIHRNGARILQLVNQVLDLAKLDAGTLRLNESPVDLVFEVRHTVASFQSLAEMKAIKLAYESEMPALPAVCDQEKLRLIVSNLLANAIKFSPSSSEVQIVLLKRAANFLCIRVSDTGPGIASDNLEKIFDRFYQIENKQDKVVEGTGIGLAIVKEFTELMGGQVTVQSTPGFGTTFEVILPIVPVTGATLPIDQPIPVEAEARLDLMEPKSFGEDTFPVILIVEDNPDVAHFVAKSLGNHFEYILAQNGQQGWEQATSRTPDLIISDVMMPEMDGYTLCRNLKNDPRTDHIPFILLTARADHDSRLTGLRERAEVYLTKPFEANELTLQVHNLLDRQCLLRERFGKFPVFDLSKQALYPGEPEGISPEAAFMGRLRELLETKALDAQYSVPQLCRDMGMSASNLHRKLAAIAGKAPVEIILAFRLERAKHLLSSTKKRVSEIAFECGFNDPDYFSRVFSRQNAISPQKWRERNSV